MQIGKAEKLTDRQALPRSMTSSISTYLPPAIFPLQPCNIINHNEDKSTLINGDAHGSRNNEGIQACANGFASAYTSVQTSPARASKASTEGNAIAG
jgi:hypothetical protein